MTNDGKKTLTGRKLYIPPMTQIGARLLAATFRSRGIDAQTTPPSDAKTLELGALYSSGEECFPEKITVGDFMKITQTEGFNPAKTAFLFPSADGPCRFGQYTSLLEKILKDHGLDEILILSPSSNNGYSSVGGAVFY